MSKLTLVVWIIITCASVAVAQSDDYKKVELYAGYSQNWTSNTIGVAGLVDEPEGLHGVNYSLTGNVARYVGIKFDISEHYRRRRIPFGPVVNGIFLISRLTNVMGGIQIKDNSAEKTFKPFVHALAGIAHMRNRIAVIKDEVCVFQTAFQCPSDFIDKDNGFAAAFGGGIDIRVSKRFDLRILQIDYLRTRRFNDSQPTLRVGIGITFH